MDQRPGVEPGPRLCSTALVACLVLGFLGCALMAAMAADLPGTALARWFDPAAPLSIPRVYGTTLALAVALCLWASSPRVARRGTPPAVVAALVLLVVPAAAGAVTAAIGVAVLCLVVGLALVDRHAVVPEPELSLA